MKKRLLSTIIIIGFISSAYANTYGAYLGGQVGYSVASTSELGFPLDDVSTVKNKGGIVGELHGGYLFPITESLSLGPEIGFGYLGYSPEFQGNGDTSGNNYASGSLKFQNQFYIPLVARAQYDINDNLYVFAKAGIAYVQTKINSSFSYDTTVYGGGIGSKGSEIGSKSQSSTVFTGGFGLGYKVTDQLALEVSYSHLSGKEAGQDALKEYKSGNYTLASSNAFVGLNYNF